MPILVEIHSALSNVSWIYFLILGLWGLYRAIRGQGVDGSYLGAATIGELVFVVQAILGLILWFDGGNAGMARAGIHALYGVFAIVFLPFIYMTVLRGDDSNRGQWVMAFATLFLFGVALRAISTSI